jgi:PmbA protein
VRKMSKQKLDIIESALKQKEIEEYEILFINKRIYETIFLKTNPDNERQVNDLEYVIRILSQNGENTGIGVVNGSSLDKDEINQSIDKCISLAKHNKGTIYHFPEKKPLPEMKLADEDIIKEPVRAKDQLASKLIKAIKNQKNVEATFGRFRLHYNDYFIRNSNGIDYDSSKTYFFIEFSLKSHKQDKLAEFWDVVYYKDKKSLDFDKIVTKWATLSRNTLNAKIPTSNSDALVIFTPRVLREALNPVLALHTSGKGYYEKLSKFENDEVVAHEAFSLIDDGLLELGLGSNVWDGEGNPHQKTSIIEKGIFKNRIYDQKYALLDGVESTGNGVRTENGAVASGITNLTITSGSISYDEMLSDIKQGFLIERFSWLRPDPISGFFGAEIRNGYYIKNGELSNPIKLGNVSGNVLEMIKNCAYITKEKDISEDGYFPYIGFNHLNVSS